MAEMLRRCEELGVVAGFLEVRTSNAGAIALYRRFGFEQKGVRKGYYPDNGEDALLFRRDFPNPPSPQ
jgi:ribosomal-protein-alanine N-acetyltransferase